MFVCFICFEDRLNNHLVKLSTWANKQCTATSTSYLTGLELVVLLMSIFCNMIKMSERKKIIRILESEVNWEHWICHNGSKLWPGIAIRKKFAASWIICVWTYNELPRSIRFDPESNTFIFYHFASLLNTVPKCLNQFKVLDNSWNNRQPL